ncbi:MAG: YidC/Oxa1 family membrane protein insertase [Candidatus Paceibacterota bacterium]|jgi:YidC/Oxa1 family membrane protein insertase
MHSLYTNFIYLPLYNGLVFLAAHLPFFDAGVIIILFTILVKVILYPLSRKAARTQIAMKMYEPEMNAIKEKYKTDKQAQALHVMNLYRDKKINPFSSIFLLLIQLPIFFALYKIFYSTGLSAPDASLLYSFVKIPATVNMHFLGLIDVTSKSIVLAVLAAVSQYFQIKLSVPAAAPKTGKGGFQDDLARSMQTQMKYVFPIMILFIAYNVAAALAIYWITSNLFMIGQEIVVRRQMMGKKEKVAELVR